MKRSVLVLLSFLFLFSCEKSMDMDNSEPPVAPEGNNSALEEGVVIIKLTEEAETKFQPHTDTRGNVKTGLTPIDGIMHSLGATAVKPVFSEGGEFSERRRRAGLHLWYYVYFEADVPVTRAVSDFSALYDVDMAAPQRRAFRIGSEVKPMGFFHYATATKGESYYDDPGLQYQWHYNNDGETTPNSRAGADIDLFRAWDVTSGDPSVIVAIVDGGIDYAHEDLEDNMWSYEDLVHGTVYGWNFYEDDHGDNFDIVPEIHGTHVAGTVAAVNGNNKGVSGVAGGSGTGDGARLMSCQVFVPNPDDPEETLPAVVSPESIAKAADYGAVISQNSWGFLYNPGETPQMPDVMQAAIDYFVDNAGTDADGLQTGPMKGGVVIFSVGNDGTSRVQYPAAAPNVISVASIGPDYRRAYYSNYGVWVDITAPGGSFRHYVDDYNYTINYEGGVLSTFPGNQYAYMEGTSMACPHVSGIAALIISKYGVGNPGFTPEDLKDKLFAATRSLDEYNPNFTGGRLGAGLIDAFWAVSEDMGVAPDPVADLDIEWGAGSAGLSWSLTADGDDGVPSGYIVYWSESPVESLDPEDLPSSVRKMTVGVAGRNPGDPMRATMTGLNEQTLYHVGIVARDRHGNLSAGAFAQGTTAENLAPKLIRPIANLYIGDREGRYGVDLKQYFTHENAEELEYSVISYDSGLLDVSINNKGLVSIRPKQLGLSVVAVRSHINGQGTTATFKVMVRDGRRDIDVYPNPVADVANIRMAPDFTGKGTVKLYNSSGAKAFESEVAIAPFEIMKIDLSGIGAGTYIMELEYGGRKVRQNIVKL